MGDPPSHHVSQPGAEPAGGGACGDATEAALRGVEEAAAELAAKQAEAGPTAEELRLSLAEAQRLAESLQAANAALASANADLERCLAERTAELQAANAALRIDRAHLQLIFGSVTEYAIFTQDLGGRITAWNPGAQRVLGFAEEEVVGQHCGIIFTPEDRAERAPEIEMCKALEHGQAADERWHIRRDGSRFWASGQLMPLREDEGAVQGYVKILRDHTDRHRAEETHKLLLQELEHRAKNTLAVVQAVAAQTLRQAGTAPELRSAFDGRLMALARSHDILARGGWEGALLTEAVERTLAAYGAGAGRILADGPPVRLAANAVVTLNLALHELATNAAKHGALSVPGGRVEVFWRVEKRRARGEPATVEIRWRERGGPPVRPPERRGFGSQMLERVLAREAGGEVRLDFAPDGVACCIRLPLGPATTPAERGRAPGD